MTMKHGVYVTKEGKAKTAPEVVDSGIPFYIGASPVQGASSPAKAGVPVLCESFEDAREKLGYSDDWTSYPLCEAMDVHFRLYGMAPAIFCNLLDPVSMQESAEAADIPVEDGQAKLPAEAILDDTLVVKEQGGSGEPYVKGTDYSAFYEQKPSSFTITRGDGSYLKYDLSTGTADTKYASCRVRYADPATGRTWEGIAYAEDYKEDAKNNQQLEVTAKVSSIAQAQELAAKHLRLHNKFARTATFTFPGSPSIAAGVTATLQGWGAWDGKYIVKQARHSIGSSGYTTQAVLRRALEG